MVIIGRPLLGRLVLFFLLKSCTRYWYKFNLSRVWSGLSPEDLECQRSETSRWLSVYLFPPAHGLVRHCASSGFPSNCWVSEEMAFDETCCCTCMGLHISISLFLIYLVVCDSVRVVPRLDFHGMPQCEVAGLLMASLFVNAALYSETHGGAPKSQAILSPCFCLRFESICIWRITFVLTFAFVNLFIYTYLYVDTTLYIPFPAVEYVHNKRFFFRVWPLSFVHFKVLAACGSKSWSRHGLPNCCFIALLKLWENHFCVFSFASSCKLSPWFWEIWQNMSGFCDMYNWSPGDQPPPYAPPCFGW